MSTARRTRTLVLLLAGVLLSGAGIAVAAGATSAATLAAPTITSGPGMTATTSKASFAFTGPNGATFRCHLDGAALTTCTSPKSYSGLTEGRHTFGVVAVKGAAQSSEASYSWLVDTEAPPAPVYTSKPSDPTQNATNSFAWSDAEPGVTFQCALENGTYTACTSPYTWKIPTSNYGQHQIAVRALDAAGNVSPVATYSFKYEKGLPTSGVPFTISGSVADLPIGVWRSVPVKVTNPNSVTIYVSALQVNVGAGPVTCPTKANIELQQANVSSTRTLTVPAGATVTLTDAGFTPPRMQLMNLPVNQDGCKGVSFPLTYSGTATN